MNLRNLVTLTLLSISLLFAHFPANAQLNPQSPSGEPTATIEPPSPNDIREFSRLLSDPRMVEWLRKNAEIVDIDAATGSGINRTISDQFNLWLDNTRGRLRQLVNAWINLPQLPQKTIEIWQSQLDGSETLRSLAFILIFLFVGAGLEWLYWQYFTPILLRLEFERHETLRQRASSALQRGLFVTGALVVFGVGSIGAFVTFDWPLVVQQIVLNFITSLIIVRLVLALAKFILSPRVPMLRLVPLTSGPAKRLYNWFGLIIAISMTGLFVSNTVAHLAAIRVSDQIAQSAALAISVLLALVVSGLLLFAVWRIGRNEKYAGQRTASNPLLPAMLGVLIIATLVLWLVGADEIMWTLIIIGLIIPIIRIVSNLIIHLFDEAEIRQPLNPITNDEGIEQDSPDNSSATTDDETGRYDLYRPVTVRLVRFILVIGALITLGVAWNVSLLSLSSSTKLSGQIFKVAVDVTVALLIADLIWVWARTAIDRRLADFSDTMGAIGGEGGGAAGPEARLATLLPILRKILFVTIVIMVGLSVLSSLGINIAPLLAGAGVVGVAIGFGAQSLVRDIVSGIFFLLDDAFRVGEYIEMDNLRGTVESMSLRSLRVRHHRGAIHTIPFGELKSLTNYSRDWVIMKLEFRVPFETDLKLIKKLVKQVGATLLANEVYGKHFIQPLKSQGVRRMEEFNMVIGVKYMCKPGEQWLIRRDAYQGVRDIFHDNGIELAQRNVKVEVISDQPLSPDAEKAVIGAAQEAVEQQITAIPAKDEP